MADNNTPAPPIEVLTEFLVGLSTTVHKHDGITLVLRGSYLLRHWFDALARPAADLDFECFERTRSAKYDRFGSATNYALTLCMYAASTWQHTSPSIEFFESEVPNDGTSLWAYGTPGERYYTGWRWHDRGGMTGNLQIDIAQAGSYDL